MIEYSDVLPFRPSFRSFDPSFIIDRVQLGVVCEDDVLSLFERNGGDIIIPVCGMSIRLLSKWTRFEEKNDEPCLREDMRCTVLVKEF